MTAGSRTLASSSKTSSTNDSSKVPTTTTTITTLPWKYRLVEPHMVFVLLCTAVKLLLPSYLKWLACDTISTSILSVWYPLAATISLIHRESQPTTTTATTMMSIQNDKNSLAAQERLFWIHYWTVGYSLANVVHATLQTTKPLFFTWNWHSYSYLPQVLAEMKFLFFVWIFAMGPVLKWYQQAVVNNTTSSNGVQRFHPLSILKRAIRPRLLEFQSFISEPISKDHWHRFIHSKAHRVLNLLVALQFLTEEWSDYLLQLLDECRSLLLLSPFLVLPSSLTQFGILYAQYVLPSARSLLARGKIIEVLYLQYWVLNICLATMVSVGSWLWWFVPFSTQLTFAVWCYLTFPRTVTEYYAHVEQELMSFGILSGESTLKVTETKTVKALRAVVARIPSASDAEGFRFGGEDADVTRRYGSRSQRTIVPRSQSAPATLLAISAIQALHDSAVLSPQHEDDDEEDEDDMNDDKPLPTTRPAAIAKNSKSLPTRSSSSERFMDPQLCQKTNSYTQLTDDHLAPSVSIIEESDESSQLSTMAMVSIDLRSDNKKVYEEVEVTMKELSAARLTAAKYHQSRSPAYKDHSSKPAPYHSPIWSSISNVTSEEQNLRPSLSSLALPATLSTRTVSDTYTPRSNTSGGFELSDVDTNASSAGLDFAESFESTGAFYDGSKRAERQATSLAAASSSSSGRKGSPEDVARRAARRSQRIRQLQEKQEQRKLNQLTETLLFMRSASTDESEAGEKSADSSFVSEASSSTGNQAVGSVAGNTSKDAASPSTRMRRLRQRSSESELSFGSVAGNSSDGAVPQTTMRRRRQRSNDSDRSFTRAQSGNSNLHKSSVPRYVGVDATGAIRERHVQRSRSRDNTTLVSVDSDKIAQ